MGKQRSLQKGGWFCLIALLILSAFAPVTAVENKGDLVLEVVSEESDEPVEGALVKVMTRTGSRLVAEGKTEADGRLRLKNVDEGTYKIEVTHPDFPGGDGAIVTVAPASDNTFTFFVSKEVDEDLVVRVNEDYLMMNSKDPEGGAVTKRDRRFLQTQIADSGNLQSVLSTVPGLQKNSLGQSHARGEHKSVTFSLDGQNVPIPLASTTSQPIDPEFMESLSIRTGNYDASTGGQVGVILSGTTRKGNFVEFQPRVGDRGQFETVLQAGAETEEGLSFFVGAKTSATDLNFEAPHPDQQELNNRGTNTSVLARLKHKGEEDTLALNISYQDADFEVPQTPASFAAGVRQKQNDTNFLVMGSWQHEIDDDTDVNLGLSYLKSQQTVAHNGVFTNFVPFPANIDPDLNEDNLPANPEDPGSPYLPTTSLEVSQLQPSLDFTHRLGENHRIRAGLTANFISSSQFLDIIDAGGGGELPVTTPGFPVPRLATAINRDGFLGGAYFSHTFPMSEELIVNYGLRAETFDNGINVSTGQISPNINVTWGPTDTQALRLSYNRVFQPPPLELDLTGQTFTLPQKVDAYELSYENQLTKGVVGKLALVRKDYTDQVDIGLLVPNTNIPLFAPINFARAFYQGVELSLNTDFETGWNGFLSTTISEARPTERGAFVDEDLEFNDHDQRVQVSGGVSHRWENGLLVGTDFLYASGFPQLAITDYNSAGIQPFGLSQERVPRLIANLNLQYATPDKDADTQWGLGVKVLNLFDDRSLVNYLSEFSGTRFVRGRRTLFNAFVRW